MVSLKCQPKMKGIYCLMQRQYIAKRRKGKHLTEVERAKIEVYLKEKKTKSYIAKAIGVSERTIYREIKRGTIILKNSDLSERKVYCYDVGQRKYEEKQSGKLGYLKIGHNHELVKFIERKIVDERMSPYAALEYAKKEVENVNICLRTLYNYINSDLFLTLSRKHLIYKPKIKKTGLKKAKKVIKAGGESIEKRSKIIDDRLELGHYEMDTVVSGKGKKACLLVLTERVSRKEIIIKMQDKTNNSVLKAIEGLRKKYKKRFNKVFKSITSDNGTEFSNAKEIEKMGVTYFYAHSYCSYERGSNENNNKLIRRFIGKGMDISKFSKKKIKEIENFMNDYPRKLFGGLSSNEVYRILENSL